MWTNERSIIRPISILDLIQRHFPNFEGFNQQGFRY